MQHESPDRESRSIAFGPFVLWPGRGLLQGGAPVRIAVRAMHLLTALVERAGDVVRKDELMASVWPGSMTDACDLRVHMAALKRVLGDEPGMARYIVAVGDDGYRFMAPVRVGEPSGFAPPPATAAAPKHNLPLARTRIFGRADEVALLRSDLEETRLVSIVGPAGVGKTTLALAVAERAMGSSRDGLWLVEMTLIQDPELVPNAIAMAIGLAANFADMLPALCDHLHDRDMLLVLDGCEHVAAATARCVVRLLASTLGVRLMVTSREPLLLGGERVRRLPGLGLPVLAAQVNAEEALLFPAIQLFVDRAVDTLESFELSDADAPAVAELCQALDGLPQAIELAASRIDAFGAGDLLRQLAEGDGLPRPSVLPKAINWSCDLLPTDQARLLRAVAVFSGTFDVEGASAVSGLPAVDAARALAALLARSLLVVDIDGDGLTYRWLETTRSCCLDRLHAHGEAPATRRRHAEHVCATLERATAEWAWRSAGEWGVRYGRFLYDLREAVAFLATEAAYGPLRIRLCVAGLQLWDHFSHTEECRLQVAHSIDGIEAAGLSGSPYEMQLKAWLAGATMFTRGFVPQAMAAMRRALEIANRLGHTDYRLRCLRMIGIYELSTGKHDAGRRTLEAFAFLAATQDPSALPESETNLALAELFLGCLSSARQRLERVLASDLQALPPSTASLS